MELKRNIAWVRRERPIIHADGVFGAGITMNPCAYVENETIYLFYAADNESRQWTAKPPLARMGNFKLVSLSIP